ncbi:MAG: WG repeat-containing protein [Bacteroidota bacterium]
MKRVVLLLLLFLLSTQIQAQSALYPFFDNKSGLWGFRTIEGEVQVEAEFRMARPFNEGLAFVEKCQERRGPCHYAFINREGELILELPGHLMVYSANQFISEGLVAVHDKQLGKFGFIDLSGQVVVPFDYDLAFNFSEGKAVVFVCPEDEDNDYREINELSDACKKQVINKSGQVVLNVSKTYFHAWGTNPHGTPIAYHEGLLRVMHFKTGKMGFIDSNGKLVIPCEYDYVDNFSEGLAFVTNLKNTYMDNPGGNIVGYIDAKNQLRIKLPAHLADLPNGCYFQGTSFESGKARMIITENDGDCANWGYLEIDHKGEIIKENWQ